MKITIPSDYEFFGKELPQRTMVLIALMYRLEKYYKVDEWYTFWLDDLATITGLRTSSNIPVELGKLEIHLKQFISTAKFDSNRLSLRLKKYGYRYDVEYTLTDIAAIIAQTHLNQIKDKDFQEPEIDKYAEFFKQTTYFKNESYSKKLLRNIDA